MANDSLAEIPNRLVDSHDPAVSRPIVSAARKVVKAPLLGRPDSLSVAVMTLGPASLDWHRISCVAPFRAVAPREVRRRDESLVLCVLSEARSGR